MAKKEAEQEASEEKPEGEELVGEGGKKLGGKKLIIIIVAAVLLLAGIGAGLYFSGILGGGEEKAAEGEHAAEGESGAEGEHGAAAPTPNTPIYYKMPEILVNLNTGGLKQTSFLKMQVALELSSESDAEIIKANLPRVLDNLNTYLRELRSSDISGSAGIYRLREELLLRLNKALYPVEVSDILFEQIVIQ